jgi:hypothetical protein
MLDSRASENILRLLYNRDIANVKLALAILVGEAELPPPVFHALLVMYLSHSSPKVAKEVSPVLFQHASDDFRLHLNRTWNIERLEEFLHEKETSTWKAAWLEHPEINPGEFLVQLSRMTAADYPGLAVLLRIREMAWTWLPADLSVLTHVTYVVIGPDPTTSQPDETRLTQALQSLPNLEKIGFDLQQRPKAGDEDWFNVEDTHRVVDAGVSEAFMRIFADKMDWRQVSQLPRLSESFIAEFQNKVDWPRICRCQRLSESFIRQFRERVDWDWISINQQLSENFIREFRYFLNWDKIPVFQRLSEDFIREFSHRTDWWDSILTHQKLSEDFLREFRDKWEPVQTKHGSVATNRWRLISQHQTLSETFVREFADKLDLQILSQRTGFNFE